MKLYQFTHYAKFYGIPSYYNIDDGEIMGRNWFFCYALTFMIWIECTWPSNPHGFPIQLGPELEEDNKLH